MIANPIIRNRLVEFAGRHLDRVEVNFVVVRRQLMHGFFNGKSNIQT
jgi:hypothetical protein